MSQRIKGECVVPNQYTQVSVAGCEAYLGCTGHLIDWYDLQELNERALHCCMRRRNGTTKMDITLAKSAVFDQVTGRDCRKERGVPYLNGHEGLPMAAHSLTVLCIEQAAGHTRLIDAFCVVPHISLVEQGEAQFCVSICFGVHTYTLPSRCWW